MSTRRLLEVTDLSVTFTDGNRVADVVRGVSFTIDRGGALAIVGESGSGKSVTARALLKLIRPPGHISGGRILLDGRDVLTMNEREVQHVRSHDIGFVFQDPARSLNPTMRVGEQIGETVTIRSNAGRKAARARAVELLAAVGIADPERCADSHPVSLSGGMRQRAMIAMALAKEPRLLVADEPTTALDVTVQRQILRLLGGLRSQFGLATLLITHDLAVAVSTSDEVAVMYAGRLVERGPSRDIVRGMRMPYTASLFGAIPRLDSEPHQALTTVGGTPPDLFALPEGCPFRPRCHHADEACVVEPAQISPTEHHDAACWHPLTDQPGQESTNHVLTVN